MAHAANRISLKGKARLSEADVYFDAASFIVGYNAVPSTHSEIIGIDIMVL